MLGVAVAMFLGALDQTIVSTAMPRIVNQLSGLDRYTWVSTIYLLISTILVPIYGKLSDLVSRKALQLFSISVFLAGSFLCGIAGQFGTLPILGDGMSQLIVFRGIQGFGGAGIFALAFIIVSDLYPPRERGKISGIFGAVFGLASIVGPLVGGYLTDHAGAWISGVDGWRWIFYVNLPLGIIALAFIIARMPVLKPKDTSRKLNYLSALLMVLTFTPIILALQLDKSVYAWSSARVLFLLGGGMLAGILWISHSFRAEHPILDLRLFKNKVFLTSNVAAFFFGAAFLTVLIFLPLYMVNVQGVSATKAGVSIIPLSMGMVLSAGLSGFLVTKIGKYKGIMIGGAVIGVIAAVSMTLILGVNTPSWVVVILMVMIGLGFGPAQSLYSLAVQNSVPAIELGQATSASQFTRQIGSTIGAAITGAIFTAALTASFAANMPASMPGSESMKINRDNSKGLAEIRAGIEKGFDDKYVSIELLFNLRGEAAKKALAALEADPQIPAEMKNRLKDGTPAMQIDAGFKAFGDAIEAAVNTGNPRAVQAILANPQAGNALSEAQKTQIAGLAMAPLPVRDQALVGIKGGLQKAADSAIIAANQVALKGIKADIDTVKVEIADKVVNGIKKSFSDAIHKVFQVSIVLMGLMLIATLFIPNLHLRTKNVEDPQIIPL